MHGKVYDATKWVGQHPGGVTAIMNRAGGIEDASRDFDFHSENGDNALINSHAGPCHASWDHMRSVFQS